MFREAENSQSFRIHYTVDTCGLLRKQLNVAKKQAYVTLFQLKTEEVQIIAACQHGIVDLNNLTRLRTPS